MKPFYLCIFFITFLFPHFLKAQKTEGKVTTADGFPVENAYIYNKTTGSHAHTNAKGSFTINQTKLKDTLQISYVGFETLLFPVSSSYQSVWLTEKAFQLEQVMISPEKNSLKTIAEVNVNINPVKSSQEILRVVPGLFIGQHAGGGKAEQIFLRGFDIDHGTDISISADGMPVNMVSHAHGQGYADLHFLIPETIEKVDFGKGPYYANKGNFATAGYVDLHTYERIKESKVGLEYGDFNTIRTYGLFNLTGNNKKHSAYLASEYSLTDGPFESPQNFNRLNLMGKYTGWASPSSKLSLQASYFQSRWDASGQIPQRAVTGDLIGRFGAIDDTEGGNTSRVNILATLNQILDSSTSIRNKLYFTAYDFELYSNFTFFLNNPVNGDQIRQKESRNIFGFESELQKNLYLGSSELEVKGGLGLRSDLIRGNELSNTLNRRTTLSHISLGDINESNFYAYADAELLSGKWLINPSVRFDYFEFMYNDALNPVYQTLSENKIRASPKLNISYNPHSNLQLYLQNGIGFHSNDTRVVVNQPARQTLPAAYGSDLGLTWKPAPGIMVNAALWQLFLEQEFIYVGDEGIVEPGGKTWRKGVDIGLRYQFTNWLFLDTDLTYSHARAIEEEKGEDYIPLAPVFTATGGLSVANLYGFSGSLRGRYLADRPANENYSVTAAGYFVSDLNINHSYKNFTFGVIIENLFNTQWNETQFDTESQLSYEKEPVSEIHFTPGTPFFIKGRMIYRF